MLSRNGVAGEAVYPRVVLRAADAGLVDIVLIAIRRDQVTDALPKLRQIRPSTVVSLIGLPRGLDELELKRGSQRYVPALPGVTGTIRADGVVDYLEVAQQPTTVGRAAREPWATALFRSAGFSTAASTDMTAWLAAHAIFIAAFESAIVSCPGGLSALAADPRSVRSLVLAVREGLSALHDRDIPVFPTSIRVIFLGMPVWFASWYSRRALGGPLGVLGMAQHSLASRRTELPALQDDVRAILKGQKIPLLEAVFGRLSAKNLLA